MSSLFPVPDKTRAFLIFYTSSPESMEKEERMDVEVLVTALTELPRPVIDSVKDATTDAIANVEQQLVQWFSGQNPNGLQIGATDENDLNRFCSYMKAVGPRVTAQLLPQLLASPYLRQLKPPRRIENCEPLLHFKVIRAPYVKQYNMLIKQYRLKKFILPYKDGGSLKCDALRHSGDGASDIYLCFIKFGSIYSVNLLPATTVAVVSTK